MRFLPPPQPKSSSAAWARGCCGHGKPCMHQSWLARTLLLFSLDSAFAMRIVLQRVKSASVTVDNAVVSSIGCGVLALVGLREGDTPADLEYCARKLCAAKLWGNEEGKGWRKAARQLDYELLLVSQFTLYGDVSNTKHGEPATWDT